MTSIVVINDDSIALELLRQAFMSYEGVACVPLALSDASEHIRDHVRICDGLMIGFSSGLAVGGWSIARTGREANPAVAIGYMSGEGVSAWAMNGVPNSVLINTTVDEQHIAGTFLRYCRMTESSRSLACPPFSFGNVAFGAAERVNQVEDVPANVTCADRGDFHDALVNAPNFVAWLVGPDHRFAFANDAYLRLVEREVMGQPFRDALPEIAEQGFTAVLDRIYRTGEPFSIKGASAEFRFNDGTRKQTYLDLNYHAVRSSTGLITGITVVGEDVTEQHRLRQRVADLHNELLHVTRVNAMGMMVSTIAHELNQPLTTIHNHMTVAKLALESDVADPRAAESLQGAADAALRAGEIIRNLRSMTAHRKVQRAPIMLDGILRDAATLATLGQSDVSIAFETQGGIVVHGDKILIQQLVFNLVRNALEAADGQPLEVTVVTADKGSVAEICVCDSGPGIGKSVLSGIFEPFVTTKPDGTGIGLSICKAIVEAHGGTITARNGPERGAILCFTLPQSK